jgi:hypothetical protein
MMMTIPRAAFGVFALLFTVATVDVARARAQTTTVTSTACAMGTLTACGSQPITTCELTVQFDLNVFLRTGGLKYTETNCSTGYKMLYKDRTTSPGQTTGGLYPTCSNVPKTGTSDDGLDADAELCED